MGDKIGLPSRVSTIGLADATATRANKAESKRRYCMVEKYDGD